MSSGILSLHVRSSLTAHCGRRGMLLTVALLGLLAHRLNGQIAASVPVAPLTGRVVNARTEAPMARVLVQANGQAVFSNSEGRFQLPTAAGVTSVQFTKPGFSLSPEERDPETLAIDPVVGPTSLEVELWPEAVLTGTVTSSEGDPLPRLSVSAERRLFQNGLRQISSAFTTTTDAHGGFRIPVPAGDYILRTQYALPDFSRALAVLPTQRPTHTANDATGTIHIASGQELQFDLHPQLATAFQTTVPLEGSTGQRYASMTLMTSEGVTFQPSQRVTSAGVVLTLPAGTYQLSARLASSEGQLFGHQVLTVPDRESTTAPLHLDMVTAIPMDVMVDPASIPNSDGSPLMAPDGSALNLQLEPDTVSAFEGNGQATRTNGRGAGSSFLVPPGTYRLVGGQSAGWALERATFGGVDLLSDSLVVGSSAGSEPIRIIVTRATGTISGVTRIGGVAARCWIVIVSEPDTLPRFQVRRSNAAGAFSIANLPLRRFRLLALPLLSSADFGQASELDQFHTYVQTIEVTTSSSAPLTLDAVPVHELYP